MAGPPTVRKLLGESLLRLILKTDKDTHFTEAIAQNGHEEENLTGLPSNVITIKQIVILSDQNLNFDVAFFGTDGFANADLDVDSYLGSVNLDLATNGFQLGGSGQYYLWVTNVDFEYTDADGDNELHVALYNNSATGKNAGATGEVVIKFIYHPGPTH